jgi:hypothetical protein
MKLSVRFTLFLLFIFTVIALPAHAQQHNVKRLGTGDAFHGSVLKTEDNFRNFVRLRRGDIDVVLQKWGWHGTVDDLVRAAETGSITIEQIQPGTQIPFMAMRHRGKPDLLREIVWSGTKPFEAWVLEFQSNGNSYRFHAPKVCANFWIEEQKAAQVEQKSAAITLSGADVCVTQSARLRINVENAPSGGSIQLTVDGQDAGTVPATSGEKELGPFTSPGQHTVTATMSGIAPVSATINVKPCPPVCAITLTPVEGKTYTVDVSGSANDPSIGGGVKSVSVEITRDGAPLETFELAPPDMRRDVKLKSGAITARAVAHDAAGQSSTNTCEATVEVVNEHAMFFVAGFGGKERLRQTLQPGDNDFDTGVDEDLSEAGLQVSQCDPIFGFEFGVLPQIGEHAELELSIGGKINTDEGDNSSIYADVAVDGVFSAGFIGAGVSFWDLTEEDTRNVDLLVHGGFNLAHEGRVQLVIEGRAPFKEFDDIKNNYVLWGGIRFRF